MIRTQIQFPDALYKKLKRVAEEQEMSLAEVVRRGVEYITKVHPPLGKSREEWKLPEPLDLGVRKDPFDDPDWRTEANLTSGALRLVAEKQDENRKYGRRSKK